MNEKVEFVKCLLDDLLPENRKLPVRGRIYDEFSDESGCGLDVYAFTTKPKQFTDNVGLSIRSNVMRLTVVTEHVEFHLCDPHSIDQMRIWLEWAMNLSEDERGRSVVGKRTLDLR